MKQRHYYSSVGNLAQRLRRHLGVDDIKHLSRIDGRRHLLVAVRHAALYLVGAWLLFRFTSPWIIIPVAALQGINILGFIILLHEQVHQVIFRHRRPRWERALGLIYAFPSLISATQFGIWHMDHHRELGSDVDDPKRAHLSPKRNARWFKALYMTPVLFLIYARAAGREATTYDEPTRRRIRRERAVNIVLHLGVITGLVALGGWGAVGRVWALPIFVFFPPAFMINRLGQHYDIDPRPEHVEAWSSLVDGNPIIRFLFLASNHHIEHHYYPSVPMYNLAELNRKLQPFFTEVGINNRTYRGLLWSWFVENRAPHTDWNVDRSSVVTANEVR